MMNLSYPSGLEIGHRYTKDRSLEALDDIQISLTRDSIMWKNIIKCKVDIDRLMGCGNNHNISLSGLTIGSSLQRFCNYWRGWISHQCQTSWSHGWSVTNQSIVWPISAGVLPVDRPEAMDLQSHAPLLCSERGQTLEILSQVINPTPIYRFSEGRMV